MVRRSIPITSQLEVNKLNNIAVSEPGRFEIPTADPQRLLMDPHGEFARLRADHPVVALSEGHYIVLRADDVLAMLTDSSTIQVEGPDYVRFNQIPPGFTARALGDTFVFDNGASHRTKRGLFARSFAHGAIRAKRSEIRRVADGIVAELPRDTSFDFIEWMAARVPAEMIATILGLPSDEIPYFSRCAHEVARALSPCYPHGDHARIEAAAAGLFGYVERHLHARLDEPRGDFLSTLVAEWQEAPAISMESLVNQVIGIVIGATDTTRAAFAMLVALLLERRDAWDALRADPSLIPGAVAEGLRFEPSVASIVRFTIAPVDIGGVVLPAGSMLRVSTMSAMRDPALHAEPDRFDIRRTDHPRLPMVFGLGPHRCIGEMLARLEMEESLAALLAGAPHIEMEVAPRMLGFGGIRQITPMEVRIPGTASDAIPSVSTC